MAHISGVPGCNNVEKLVQYMSGRAPSARLAARTRPEQLGLICRAAIDVLASRSFDGLVLVKHVL